MPGYTNDRDYTEKELRPGYPEVVILSPENDVACPRCGAQAGESQKLCFECRMPLNDEATKMRMVARNKTISKAIYYGLLFQGFLAGVGFLAFIVLAFHFFQSVD